ncbi:MAG: hypothetical protein HYZ14_12510 [Bacteroidetes bacterium]|nr:hypothetical protein [Bacteroidota bacterium]
MEELIQTIPKNSVLDHSQDYEFLRQKGLEHIQKLGSKIWTDYNYHDPGITLMELLSYAITDLGYRTGFEMKDLLAPADGDLSVFNDCFHKAAKIFPCNQVTLLDLRKILIDIEGIRNAWIKPKPEFETTFFVDFNNTVLTAVDPGQNIYSMKIDKLNGLYDIVIEFDRNVIKISEPTKEEEVLSLARKEVHKYRNLCEDYLSFPCSTTTNQHVKKTDGTEEIKLFADIDILPDANIEQILAEVLFRVEQFLAPHVGFYSMQDLFDKGLSSDQIFDGPLLNHGFIDSNELSNLQKFEIIRTSDIYNIVMDIEGVTAVRNLGITRQVTSPCTPALGTQTPEKWSLKLHNAVNLSAPLDLELMLNTNTTLVDPASGVNKINLFRGLHEIPVQQNSIDYGDVKSKLESMRISERKKKFKPDNETFDLEIPAGEFRELDNYYPVQNELPLTYGTGEAGLPLNATNERRAQAKQLKAYLLFFEQQLANYLSQLLHVRDLFSWNDKIDKTYYSQIIQEVKDIADLYVTSYLDENGNPVNLVISGVLQENTLSDVIQKDSETPDIFDDRRNRFLNHLISRFNEVFTDYTLAMKGIGKKADIIPDKAHFLADYDVISHGRGKAFDYKKLRLIEASDGDDYTPDVWDTENVCGYERRVCRFLGIENYKRRFLFSGHDFSIASKMDPLVEKFFFRLLIPFGGSFIEITDSTLQASDDDAFDQFELVFLAQIPAFQYAAVDSVPDYWFEILVAGPTVIARSQNFTSATERNNALLAATAYFSAADIDPVTGYKTNAEDGLHVIEHILLRPKGVGYDFLKISAAPQDTVLVSEFQNVKLTDQNIDPQYGANVAGRSIYEEQVDGTLILLYNIFSQSYASVLQNLELYASDFEQYVLAGSAGQYYFYVVDVSNNQLGESIAFVTEQERDDAVSKFLAFYNLKKNNTVGTCNASVDPYSFRATVVLPAWTTRALEFSYRNMAETIIRTEAPAHVALDIFWIDQTAMRDLEISYRKFLIENAKGIPNAAIFPENPGLFNFVNDVIDELNALQDAFASVYDIKPALDEDFYRSQPGNLGHIFADVTDPQNAAIVKATIVGGDLLPTYIAIQQTVNYIETTYNFAPNNFPPNTFTVGSLVFVAPSTDLSLSNVTPGEWTVFIETINENEQISCHEITLKIIPDSEAVWIINEPKHAHCYDVDDVLAYAFDPDNSPTYEVTNAVVLPGYNTPPMSLPPGTSLTATGKIVVTNPALLDQAIDDAGQSITYTVGIQTTDSIFGLTNAIISILIPFDESLTANTSLNCQHIDKYSDTDLTPHPNSTDIVQITDTDGIDAITIVGGTTLAFLNSIGINLVVEGPIGEVNPIHAYFRVVNHAVLKAYIDNPANAGNTTFPVVLEVTDDCGYVENIQVDICVVPDTEAVAVVVPVQHINVFVNGTTVVTITDFDQGIATINPLPGITVLSSVGLAISYLNGQALIKVVNQVLFEAASQSGGLFTPTIINSKAAFTYSFTVVSTDNCGGTTTLPITIQMYKDLEAVYVFTFPMGTPINAYLNYTPPQEYEQFELLKDDDAFQQKSAQANNFSPLNASILFDSANPVVASPSDPDGPIKSAVELIDTPLVLPGNSFYKLGNSITPFAYAVTPQYDQSLSSWGAVLNPITGTISVALSSKEMETRFLENGLGSHYHRIKTTDIYGGTTIHDLIIEITKDHSALYIAPGTYPKSVGSYVPGEVIKYPSDPDGPIVAAAIISGTLPPGTEFDTNNGEIRVQSPPKILVAPATSNEVTFTFGGVTGTAKSAALTTEPEKKTAPASSEPASASALVAGEWNLVISTVDIYGGTTSSIDVNIKILPKITAATVTVVKDKGKFVVSLPDKYPAIFPPKKGPSTETL